jgi:WD40 repeat protein
MSGEAVRQKWDVCLFLFQDFEFPPITPMALGALALHLDARDSVISGNSSWLASVRLTDLLVADLPAADSLSTEVATLRTTCAQLENEMSSNSDNGRRLSDFQKLENRISDLRTALHEAKAVESALIDDVDSIQRNKAFLEAEFASIQAAERELSSEVARLSDLARARDECRESGRQALDELLWISVALSKRESDLMQELMVLKSREVELRNNDLAMSVVGQNTAPMCPVSSVRPRISDSHSDVDVSQTIRQASVIKRHRDPVTCLAFSGAQPLLASGGEDSIVDLIETSTWESLGQLQDATGCIMAVAFSPSDSFMLSACWDHAIRLYRLSASGSAKLVHNCRDHTDCVYDAKFLSDDEVVSCSRDGTVKLFDAKKMQIKCSLTSSSRPMSLCALWGHSLVVTSHFDGCLRAWDFRQGGAPIEIRAHRKTAVFVDTLYDSSMSQLVSFGTEDRQIVVSDIRTKNVMGRVVHNSAVARERVQLAVYGDLVFIGGHQGDLFAYDVTTYKLKRQAQGAKAPIFAVAGKRGVGLATGDKSGTVKFWGYE